MKLLHRLAHWFGLGWDDTDADWFYAYPDTYMVCIRCGRLRKR